MTTESDILNAQAILDGMGPIPIRTKADRLIRLLADKYRQTTRRIEMDYSQDEQDHVEEFAIQLALRVAKLGGWK